MSEKQIIEINGIKLEVDMRYAKVIENYKVGDNVKVLVKKYGDDYQTFPGVIVGFDNFNNLPTITVCYVDLSYSAAEIKFISINAKTKDIEIVHMADYEKAIDKTRAIDYLDRVIFKAESELNELRRKKTYFLEKYNQHMEPIKLETNQNE